MGDELSVVSAFQRSWPCGQHSTCPSRAVAVTITITIKGDIRGDIRYR